MQSIVLPKRNRVMIVHNDMTQLWEVQRGGIVILSAQLGACEFYCETHGLEITNFGNIEAVRATARTLRQGVAC